MEDKNHRRQKRRELNKKSSSRKIKKVLIALLLIVAIPSALGMGYIYYMANKIDSRHIDDPIWDAPLEDPIGTGENTTPSEDLIVLDSDEEITTGETPEFDEVLDNLNEEGYTFTDDGKVITDLGEYETEDENNSSDDIPDFVPPKETDSLGIEKEVEDKLSNLPIVKNNKIKNILLLGIDSQNGVGRSDSIIILTIDQTTKKIKLSSIMRDSYVHIENRGMDKINHAYSFGGAKLALKTVNTNFNMNIKDFAVVNFSQLPKIVDSVGGVPMALTAKEAKHMGFKDGAKTYHLNGAQALRFSRIRKIDSDFARSNRQRKVLKAVLNKLLSLSPGQVNGAANELLPMIRTTLSANEIIATGINVVSSNYKIDGKVFPPESSSRGVIINGVWYLKFDRAKQAEAMHSFIFNQ